MVVVPHLKFLSSLASDLSGCSSLSVTIFLLGSDTFLIVSDHKRFSSRLRILQFRPEICHNGIVALRQRRELFSSMDESILVVEADDVEEIPIAGTPSITAGMYILTIVSGALVIPKQVPQARRTRAFNSVKHWVQSGELVEGISAKEEKTD
ncbi:biotin synthase [Striga asiatica]|uniref:Biotin synthase n=1 Tax=Striga asiatica TaxID=4170 RepID=A0A5A7QGI5_STRAF|nr:biotin synthase [Striga asiatica]